MKKKWHQWLHRHSTYVALQDMKRHAEWRELLLYDKTLWKSSSLKTRSKKSTKIQLSYKTDKPTGLTTTGHIFCIDWELVSRHVMNLKGTTGLGANPNPKSTAPGSFLCGIHIFQLPLKCEVLYVRIITLTAQEPQQLILMVRLNCKTFGDLK